VCQLLNNETKNSHRFNTNSSAKSIDVFLNHKLLNGSRDFGLLFNKFRPLRKFLLSAVALAANCSYFTTLNMESESSPATLVTKSQPPLCHSPIVLLAILVPVSQKKCSRFIYTPGWWHGACEWCPWAAQIVAFIIWTAFLPSCGEKK